MLVTHDLELAGKTDRIIRIKGGTVVSDTSTTATVPLRGEEQ